MAGIRSMVKLVTVWLLLCAPTALIAVERASIVVMLGDSTTACGQNRSGAKLTDCIQAYLARAQSLPVTLINSGKGSDTAKGGYARLPAAVLAHEPDVVTVAFGLNDTILLSPAEYRLWLEKIIQNLRQKTRAKVMLVTSTPFNNARHAGGKQFAVKGGLDEYMDENICAQTRKLAREYDLPICDLHRYFTDKFKKDPALINVYILPDGVHLTDEGNRVAAEYLAPMLAMLIGRPGSGNTQNTKAGYARNPNAKEH